ncbi:D-amino-acid oxidase, partial [Erwinia amylovora]|nr:D-amino-acid oxidase [Erwinia amylovora]
LGWVRINTVVADDLQLALASVLLWAALQQGNVYDVGYRNAGIMFFARTEAQSALHLRCLKSV